MTVTITIGWWILPFIISLALMIAISIDLSDPIQGPFIGLWASCPFWLVWALWGRG